MRDGFWVYCPLQRAWRANSEGGPAQGAFFRSMSAIPQPLTAAFHSGRTGKDGAIERAELTGAAAEAASPPLLFVIGAYRGGTSLLLALLNNHPDIALMYEANLLTALPGRGALSAGSRRKIERLNHAFSRHGLDDLLEGGPMTAEQIYSEAAKRLGKTVGGEKSPDYQGCLPDLFRRHPKAHFVVIWRNPVETARSLADAAERNRFFRRHGMLHRLIAAQEKLARDSAGVAQKGGRVMHVSYDELLADAGEVCERLCAFLGVRHDPQMTDLGRADLSVVPEGDHHSQLRAGVIRRRVRDAGLEKSPGEMLAEEYLPHWNALRAGERPGGISRLPCKLRAKARVGRLLQIEDRIRSYACTVSPEILGTIHRQLIEAFEARAANTGRASSLWFGVLALVGSAGVAAIDLLSGSHFGVFGIYFGWLLLVAWKSPPVLTLAVCGLLAIGRSAALTAGCGSNDDQQQDKYNEGYEAGVKAEQAKWSAEKLKLAQTYIKEQEESQENIVRLLRGDVTGITVDSIAMDDAAGKGQVHITADFSDGSQLKGVIDVVKIDSYWYFEKVTHTPS